MMWIVDSCMELDVHLSDATSGRTSAACLAHFLPQGHAITSTTFNMLGPAFRGNIALEEAFLVEVRVAHQAFPGSMHGLAPSWSEDDTAYAFAAWHRQAHHRQAQAQRSSGDTVPRSRLADFFIATTTRRFAGIIQKRHPFSGIRLKKILTNRRSHPAEHLAKKRKLALVV